MVLLIYKYLIPSGLAEDIELAEDSVVKYFFTTATGSNQKERAELFDTSILNINMCMSNILEDRELVRSSVIKEYLTTATDGKDYKVTFYSLDYTRSFSNCYGKK